MSETQRFKGILKPIEMLEGVSIEQYAKDLLESKHGITELTIWNDTYLDQLMDEEGEKLHENSGRLFTVEIEELELEGCIEGEIQPDGSITFDISFYNGGCSLSEAIDSAVVNAK